MILAFFYTLFSWNSFLYLLGENKFIDLVQFGKIIEKHEFLLGWSNDKKLLDCLKLGHFKLFVEIILASSNFTTENQLFMVFTLKKVFLFLIIKKNSKKNLHIKCEKKKKKENQDFKLLLLKIKKIFQLQIHHHHQKIFNLLFLFFSKIFLHKKKTTYAKKFLNFSNSFSKKKNFNSIRQPNKSFENKYRFKKNNDKGHFFGFISSKNDLKPKKIFKKKKKFFILKKIVFCSDFKLKVMKKSTFRKKIYFLNNKILFEKIVQQKYFFFFYNFLPVFFLGYYFIGTFNSKFFSYKVDKNYKIKTFLGSKIFLKKNWSFIFVSGIKYAKIGLIGKGGNSKVYKIIDPNNRVFALKKTKIKKYSLENLHGSINEISILKTLNDQAGIIKIKNVDILLQKGIIYIVLEYGVCDLEHIIKKMNKERRSLLLIKFFWKQILEAVQTIHEGRVVHGDIKPSNFLLIKNSLKIIDFGIAKQIQKDTTNITRHIQIGTLNYMSPEAIMDKPCIKNKKKKFRLSRSADIWSLGCILFQMIYKKPPFYHLTVLKKIQAIINRSYEILFLPTKIKFVIDTIKGCLERNPESRPLISELLEHPFLTSGNILKFNKKKI
ncbi:spindle checkpoint protein kinase (nucleomorph) [Chroomonas mesostigmatica CCMP1168]|uniref:Spindle checkpoint protein kinase n=1 Tax=Chroomonas mesostigmatica CCMP1168 TaxID=1195612 RepID=J7G2Q6_9CRYP|nr:spindle checkpoint protein kinase [Chroomonas mesostigmatica CCMP1168]